MKTGRLKALNKQIEDMLTHPLPLKLHKDKDTHSNQYLKCSLCEDVRRENYRLKQEALEAEQHREEYTQTRRQLEALKELYELKCREADLLRNQLEQAERAVEIGEMQRESFKREGVAYFQGLLGK